MGVGGDDSWMSPGTPSTIYPDKPISLDVDPELICQN